MSSSFWQDLRYGLRILRKSPSATLLAALTLAIGIGTNTTLFTAFNAVALKPLPVKDAANIVRLKRSFASLAQGSGQYAFSYPEYILFRDQCRTFSSLIAVSWPVRVYAVLPGAQGEQAGAQGAVPLRGQLVSENFFTALGVNPALGRTFVPGERAIPGASSVVVLSHTFWERRMNSDPQVAGKRLQLNGAEFAIAGVAPKEFIGTANPPQVPDFWAPLDMQAQLAPGENWLNEPLSRRVQILGHLTGAGPRQAQAEAEVLAKHFAEANPFPDITTSLTVERATYFGGADDPRFQAFVALLMVVAGLVLLVACLNLANMLLARNATRQQEIAVRLAVGASRWRLVRQLLTEYVLLALLGGVAGLLISMWTTQLFWLGIAGLVQGMFNGEAAAVSMTPDFRVFAFTLLLSVATGILFGLWPALRSSKSDLTAALKTGNAPLAAGVSRSRLRNLLVAGQMTASMVLLVMAGLLLRGLEGSRTAEPGLETQRTMLVAFERGSDETKANELIRRVKDTLQTLPEVASVSLVDRLPFTGTWTPPLRVEGAEASDRVPESTLANYVSPEYFQTVGIPILRGRTFAPAEVENAAPVAVVSESAARRFWPGRDPLGKTVMLDLTFHGAWAKFEVVGVVKDVRSANLSRLDPTFVYLPTSAAKFYDYAVLIRASGDPRDSILAGRSAIERLDKNLSPGLQFVRLEQFLQVQKTLPETIALFAGILAVLALSLAGMGVYGVTAYAVTQRTREIGIRMAIGASTGDVVRLVIRDGMVPILAGCGIGLGISAGISAILRATLAIPGSTDLLFGTGAFNPVTFLGSSAFLTSVAFVALYLPARRAMKVDPVEALRYQ